MTETNNNNKVEGLNSLKVERLFNVNKPFNCRNNAFTLAEGATHVETCNGYRKAAFTLAEVLITLGVIGVVAAITMPMLITNINDRANSERHANIAYKITQAMEQMRAHGKLTAYDSTSAFVDELQKYLKITKRCDADHIAECWPTETVINAAGEEYDVSTCKTRANLIADSESTDENVGLILADGASIILTYDTENPNVLDVGDKVTASMQLLPIGKNKSREFAYTTSVTGAIDFVTDVNGKKGPNSETRDGKFYDIRQFRSAHFIDPVDPRAAACTAEWGSQGCLKVIASGGYQPVNCDPSSDVYAGADLCGPTPSTYSSDYWAGAKKACIDAGMQMPDQTTLKTIYNNKSDYTTLPSSGWFWSSTEGSSYPQYFAWSVGFSNGSESNSGKDYSGIGVVCVGN